MKRIFRRSPIVLVLVIQIIWIQSAKSQHRKHQRFLNQKTTVITTSNDTVRGKLQLLDDTGMNVLLNQWVSDKNAEVQRLAYSNVNKVTFFKKENIALGICAGVVAGAVIGAIVDRPAPEPPRQSNMNITFNDIILEYQARQR